MQLCQRSQFTILSERLKTASMALPFALAAMSCTACAAPAQGQATREFAPGLVLPIRRLAPELPEVPDYAAAEVPPVPENIPEGFTPLFNGEDLTGWHISRTSRHGENPDFQVRQGVVMGMQGEPGQGGLLISDRSYRNFEIQFEFKPDWGSDSGLLFRTTENGAAYQVTLDYVTNDKAYTRGPGMSLGQLVGEGGVRVGERSAVTPADDSVPEVPAPDWADMPMDGVPSFWKREQWNTVRIKVTGETPHVTVWINGVVTSDMVDTQNHAVGGMVSGPIALQVHGGWQRWRPGSVVRWRNLAIRELAD